MFITKQWLHEHRACGKDLRIFIQNWAEGVELSAEHIQEAYRLGMNVFWLERLLPPSFLGAYRESTAAAQQEYENVWARAALAGYQRIPEQAWAAHDRQRADAELVFDQARVAALIAALEAAHGLGPGLPGQSD